MRPLGRLFGIALAIVGAWMVVGIFFASQNYARALSYHRILHLDVEICEMLISTFVWALLTPFLLYAAQRSPVTRSNFVRPLLQMLVTVLLFASVHAAFDARTPTITDGGRVLPTRDFAPVFFATFHTHFLLGATVVALANLVSARRETDARRIHESEVEAELSRAQLQLLQAQIQPHFLFNTLNAAAALLRVDRERAATTVLTLADLLQRSQELGQQTFIPVSSEVAFLESYLTLQKVRFSDRLTARVDVAPSVEDVVVPSLILQPLVENAILHGVIRRTAGGTVAVRIFCEGDDLRMEVRDDGPGATPQELAAGRGLGVANTRSRLQCLFKDRFGLQFSRGGGQFVAAVTIPIRRAA